MSGNTHSDYQVIVLSENYYLWLGLKTLFSRRGPTRPDTIWFNTLNPEIILRLRQQILLHTSKTHTLVFVESLLIDDLKVYLPMEGVTILPDDLPIDRLNEDLKTSNCKKSRLQALTRAELRVCSMISKGLSLAHIASILNKSPKTIYTHKRNAMLKFQCQHHAEFHRKISLHRQVELNY